MPAIRPGDVVLDLAQGSPMLVVDRAAETAAEWMSANDYDLLDNYANARFDAGSEDTVWTCIYCSNLRSEPTKTYDFPASRLKRHEHERARDGERVQDTLAIDLLADLAVAAADWEGDHGAQAIGRIARDAGVDRDVVDAALELADVELTVGSDA